MPFPWPMEHSSPDVWQVPALLTLQKALETWAFPSTAGIGLNELVSCTVLLWCQVLWFYCNIFNCCFIFLVVSHPELGT